jgi:hypothetical protein
LILHPATLQEFTDNAKDAYSQVARDAANQDRDPAPMIALDTPEGVHFIGVDSEFFRPDQPERRRDLISKFVIPMIREHAAWRAAIMHAGWMQSGAGPEQTDVIVVTIVDGEVSVTFWAPREHPDRWREWSPNRQTGLFVTPIQEALR